MITWKLYNNIHHVATRTYTDSMVKDLWVTSAVVPLIILFVGMLTFFTHTPKEKAMKENKKSFGTFTETAPILQYTL